MSVSLALSLLLLLLGQQPAPLPILPDSPVGWLGWAGFLSSGGVLAWLLFRFIPALQVSFEKFINTKDLQLGAKDTQLTSVLVMHSKEMSDFIQAKEVFIGQILDRFRAEANMLRQEYKEALTNILEHCRSETAKLAEVVQIELKRIKSDSKDSSSIGSGKRT